MKLALILLSFLSSPCIACVDFSGNYGTNEAFQAGTYEKIEQVGCDKIDFIEMVDGKEALRVSKKTDGKMSSNLPIQNEFALIQHETGHMYYVVVKTNESGFVEGSEFKLPNGDRKRIARRYSQGGVTETVDIIPLVN